MHTDTCQDITVTSKPSLHPDVLSWWLSLQWGPREASQPTPRPFSARFGSVTSLRSHRKLSRLGSVQTTQPPSPRPCRVLGWGLWVLIGFLPPTPLEKRGPVLLSVWSAISLPLLLGLSYPDLTGSSPQLLCSRARGSSSLCLAGKERGKGSSKAVLMPRP